MTRINIFLFLALVVLVNNGCPIFVDTTPPTKPKVAENPFNVQDSLYYYDPNYFADLDRTRPYQVPANLKVHGYDDQWVIAPEFAGASMLDQVLSRITAYGWYCVMDSNCQCMQHGVMFPGNIFYLSNVDSVLVGQDRVYPGDCPWSIAERIMQTDSLQADWKEKQLIKQMRIMKDSLLVVDSCITLKEHEVLKERILRCTILASALLILFFSFYYRKELASLAKKVT